MKIFPALAICVLCFSIFGCTKNILDYGDVEKLNENEALIKINYASYYRNNPSVYFKINGQRVSGLLTARTPFPGGGYNTGGASSPDFLAVNPGNLKLSVVLPFKVDNGKDSLVIYDADFQVSGGKKYSFHITDTAANTKNFLTEEQFERPNDGVGRYRFVNLMPNVAAVDLYYGTSATIHTADTLIAGNVNYLSITPDIMLKSGQSKTWKIRPAGAALTTATILASYTSASTFLNQRAYTIFASGYQGITAAPRRPYVSFYLVR